MLHPIFSKRFGLLLIFFVLSEFAIAQADSANMTLPATPASDSISGEHLFIDYADEVGFPGGEKAMYGFIAKNLRYVSGCMDVVGTVYISFIIEKDGSVSTIKELKGIPNFPAMTQEAIRVISIMPKWKPATQNGKPIRSRYTVPVRFTLR